MFSIGLISLEFTSLCLSNIHLKKFSLDEKSGGYFSIIERKCSLQLQPNFGMVSSQLRKYSDAVSGVHSTTSIG